MIKKADNTKFAGIVPCTPVRSGGFELFGIVVDGDDKGGGWKILFEERVCVCGYGQRAMKYLLEGEYRTGTEMR